ncbi:hypothetical protein [Scytonema sp. NUACC26]|uniref:hypothetical protein n=1 Tax=Scytonema sp. NUACC26 TaxID=3140176 RepID=UPI0038B40DB0
MVRRKGWNIVHRYQFTPSFLKTAAESQVFALASLPGESEPLPEAQAAQTISNLARSDRVVWWDFPEERRYWEKGEMALVTNYATWTRKYDPKKRPNYMYIPGHYTAEDVKQYVPYLDIIPASVYTTYVNMPHAWVRWRIETTLKGIHLAHADIGSDYLHGKKTPVAVLELFYEGGKSIMTSQGAYHDFWQSIVSGARGILIFSYWHKRDHPSLDSVWQTYNRAAQQITGPDQLGSVILHGKELRNVRFEITTGPQQTSQFKFNDMAQPISFPSVNFLTKVWNNNIYVIAVNSTQEPVVGKFIGLPPKAKQATVLFENNVVPVTDGTFNTRFASLGVHIFKILSL